MVARVEGAATTREPTLPTAHEPTQEILIGRIVSAGHLDVAIQALLHGFKAFVADDGGHGDGNPLVLGVGCSLCPEPPAARPICGGGLAPDESDHYTQCPYRSATAGCP